MNYITKTPTQYTHPVTILWCILLSITGRRGTVAGSELALQAHKLPKLSATLAFRKGRIMEHPKLEVTHKGHEAQLLTLPRTAPTIALCA